MYHRGTCRVPIIALDRSKITQVGARQIDSYSAECLIQEEQTKVIPNVDREPLNESSVGSLSGRCGGRIGETYMKTVCCVSSRSFSLFCVSNQLRVNGHARRPPASAPSLSPHGQSRGFARNYRRSMSRRFRRFRLPIA